MGDARGDREVARDSAQVKKIRACWLDLEQLGALQDPSERVERRAEKEVSPQ